MFSEHGQEMGAALKSKTGVEELCVPAACGGDFGKARFVADFVGKVKFVETKSGGEDGFGLVV